MTNPAKKKQETIPQTIGTNLNAPRLYEISVKEFNKFIRLRRLYEEKVLEKNREPVVKITAVS